VDGVAIHRRHLILQSIVKSVQRSIIGHFFFVLISTTLFFLLVVFLVVEIVVVVVFFDGIDNQVGYCTSFVQHDVNDGGGDRSISIPPPPCCCYCCCDQ